MREQHYTIIETNFSCRLGEIDIIAYKQDELYGKTLCFIEVKTRKHTDGSAERAVDKKKLGRMKRAAIFFCRSQYIDAQNQTISFEQVSVYLEREEPKIYWYQILSF